MFFMIKYDESKVRKLPPGEALGARDLQVWSSRRFVKFGMPQNLLVERRKSFKKKRKWKRG